MSTLHNDGLSTMIDGVDEPLITVSLRGEEMLSALFFFDVKVITLKKMRHPKAMLERNVTVIINQAKQKPRYIHGMIKRFSCEGEDDMGHHGYSLSLVPHIWRLSLSRHDRIFKNQTSIEIIREILQRHQLSHLNVERINKRLLRRKYCTQYNESDFDFISRLLEAEGVFYFFSFNQQQCTWNLSDDYRHILGLKQDVIYRDDHFSGEHLCKWQPRRTVGVNQVLAGDFNYHEPRRKLSLQRATYLPKISLMALSKPLVRYQFPGGYSSLHEGENIVDKLSRVRQWQANQIELSGNYTDFQPGLMFDLEHHSLSQCGRYYLYQVRHEAIDHTHFNQGNLKNQAEKYYINHGIALGENIEFVPERKTPKPIISASQTATVMGDENGGTYFNELGEIKIKFPWDITGPADYSSSGWARVVQMQAGSQWGSQFYPQVGQSVKVVFIHGDPDKPVVIGAINDDDHMPAFNLPEQKGVSGIKTRCGHELSFDDTPNSAKIILRSDKALKIDAFNELIHHVGGSGRIVIKQDQITQVLNGAAKHYAQTITLSVGSTQLVLDGGGIQLKSAKVRFLVKGAEQTLGLVRQGDYHHCPKVDGVVPHHGGHVPRGAHNVLINQRAVVCEGATMPCSFTHDAIKKGVKGLWINHKPVATLHSPCEHGGEMTTAASNVSVGPHSGEPLPLTMDSKAQEKYWLILQYPKPDQLQLPNQWLGKQYAATVQYQHNKKQSMMDGTFDGYAQASIDLQSSDQVSSFNVRNTEIVAVNNQPIGYPVDHAQVCNHDFHACNRGDKKPHGPRGEDKVLDVQIVHPPMMVNLREDKKGHSHGILTQDEIDHIKRCGCNITVFIHGYNIAEGQLNPQIEAVKLVQGEYVDATVSPTSALFSAKTATISLCPRGSLRTLYRDIDMLKQQFPILKTPGVTLLDNILEDAWAKDQWLNGQGCYNWLTHIEDNLNRATGQFDRTDYRKFTRLVHVQWSGDVFAAMNFANTEDYADDAGKKLVALFKQLHHEKILTHVIAHSLGCRVLLKAMDKIGESGLGDILEHVFMWEAAVPDTALSNDPARDKTIKENGKFTHAYKASKKITLLTSDQDDVLRFLYFLNNMCGKSPRDMALEFSDSSNSRAVQEFLSSMASNKMFKAMLYGDLAEDEQSLHLKSWKNQLDISLDKQSASLSEVMAEFDTHSNYVPALGYVGPDKTDPFIQSLLASGKLIHADCSAWVRGHSAMKNPSPDAMKHVYQRWIINKDLGIKKFGNYSF